MTTYNLPQPNGETWERWAATIIQLNPQLQNYVTASMDYKDFGNKLSQIEGRTPRPAFFRNWENWAAALRRALST